MLSIEVPLAFLRKDFLSDSRYKFAFLMQGVGIFFNSLFFFFLSRLFDSTVSKYMAPYGTDYFSFVLIGFALSSYLHVAIGSFSSAIRNAQMLGTLEALLVTQTGTPTIILSSSLYSFLLTSVRVLVYLAFGALLFGMDLGRANYPGALLILVLTVASFCSLGILSASFIMVWKRGEPFGWVLSMMTWFLGGVYFPVTVLPDWLRKISFLFPVTHALDGMRLALLQGYPTGGLLPSVVPLLVFTLVAIPLSLLFFDYAVKRAKADGSLTKY